MKKALKSVFITLICLEILGFISAITLFIISISIQDFDQSFRLSGIAGSIFFAVVGSSMVLMIIGLIMNLKIKRAHAYSSDLIADEFGYENKYLSADSYKVENSSSKKQVYYCSYCGYGTDSPIGECPQCGGPIKEKQEN